MNLEPPYTMDEVCAMLKCKEESVVARITSGEIYACKVINHWVFPRQAFIAGLESLAIQQTEERRKAKTPPRAGTSVIQHARKPGRQARVPPTLPALAQQN